MRNNKPHRLVYGLGPMDPKFVEPNIALSYALGDMQADFKFARPQDNPGGLGPMEEVYAFKYPLEETPGLGEPSGIAFPAYLALPEGLGDFDAPTA